MADRYAENRERLATFSEAAWERAKSALETKNPLLRQAGLAGISTDILDAGRSGLESRDGRNALLEAIVRIANRPPLTIRNGRVDLAGMPVGEFDPGVDGWIKSVEPMLGSIGRIEFINHDMDWGGTGWVIRRDGGHLIIATNRHVAEIVARRTSSGGGVFMFVPGGGGRYGASIDFFEEVDALQDQARSAPILRFDYLAADDAADVAFARIAEVPKAFGVDPLPLADTDTKEGEKEHIAVVGYPARDSRNDATHMERYFQGLYDVKRLSPGLMHNRGNGNRLIHDATTLGGNSGSPVISLERKAVVGLHFSGRYGVGNSAVRVSTLKQLLDGDRTAVAGADLGALEDESRDGKRQAADLAGRTGFDPGFLVDFDVPMPDVSAIEGIDLVRPSDATESQPHELRYTHFGVLYCGKLRSPVVAAVNIDGEKAVPIKRSSDRWFYDLRIPVELQIGSEAYSEAGFDRGHMVKREDPNWGDSAAALAANFDTFHFTNCSPQHSGFNRNIQTWRGLEDYILQNARTQGFKACVFTGPIIAGDLETLEGLVIPREYWKLVVMPAQAEDGRLVPHVTAYVLSQGDLIQGLLQQRGVNEASEGFLLGPYKTFQISVEALESATGMSFGDLKDFDALAAKSDRETRLPYRPLTDLADVVL